MDILLLRHFALIRPIILPGRLHFLYHFIVFAIPVHDEAEKEHRGELHTHEYPLHRIQEVICVHDYTDGAVIYQVIIINIIKWNQAMKSKISLN